MGSRLRGNDVLILVATTLKAVVPAQAGTYAEHAFANDLAAAFPLRSLQSRFK
jgi:hypothetical protein